SKNFGSFAADQLPPRPRPLSGSRPWQMNRELTELKSLRILPTPEAMGRVRPAIKTQTTQSNWKMNRVNLNRTRSIRQILPAALIGLYLCMSCAPEAFGAGEELLPRLAFVGTIPWHTWRRCCMEQRRKSYRGKKRRTARFG